ncbi:Acid phosphatase, putative [Candida maltosa Xu316]|uniref:Acid phosphatase, putative n=1 Tax=Candida maltosa (strain Xu316) TaxID=1245528 RepID=M3J8E3_CANMX|nr:Acid phosphatase, putative [Candida maltosa Xu316]
MVVLSKLINAGFLLVGQSVFQDVATPQQASVEQYNIIKYLGGSGPYIQNSGWGISTDVPNQCFVEQIQMISRHGERYPSKGDGKFFDTVMQVFKSYGKEFKGDLAFLNNYEYFVTDNDYYEKETSPKNSKGPYAGTTNMLRHGAYFRNRYGHLFNQNEKLVVFSSNSGRCFQSGEYFARGFLGDDYSDDSVQYVVVDEDPKMGGNSLTPRYACKTLNESLHDDLVNQYNKTYLQYILNRWQADNPGLELTTSHVQGLFLWTAFEINVKGSSPFANLFTNDEYIRNGYRNDVVNYYGTGPGNNVTKIAGSPMVEAFLKILQDETKIWLSFTHDTDIEMYLTSMGLIVPSEDLPVDRIPFPNPYNSAELFPQGARIYTEKLSCGDSSYVRFIVNDSVYPFPGCSSGPGFSCELTEFIQLVRSKLDGVDFKQQCQVDGPTQLTFYWDYTTTEYNAPLIDQ